MPDRPLPSASRSLMARAEASSAPPPAPPRPVNELLIPPNRWTPEARPFYYGTLAPQAIKGSEHSGPMLGLFGQPIAGTGQFPPPADRTNPLWGRDVALPAPKGPRR